MTDTAHRVHGYLSGELDLLGVLETVIARAPRVLKSGSPNLAFVRAANAALASPDDENEGVGFSQVEFWLTLAREAKLIAEEGARLVATREADEFFELAPEERCERMRALWLNSRELNELLIVPEIELPGLTTMRTLDVVSDAPSPDTLAEARAAAVELALSLEGPTAFKDFVRRAERGCRDLLLDHSDDGSWRNVYYRGIRERGGREDLEREGNWDLVEGMWLKLLCRLPLSKFGYIHWDEAAQSLEPATGSPADPDPSFEIVVQPNFEVVAIGDRPDVGQLWRLARISEPQPSDRVRRYLLEKRRFADALGRGHDFSELVEFLADLSRNPLPQNVRFSLEDWGALSERVKIWPDALFVEAEGVEDLAESLPRVLRETFRFADISGGHAVAPMPTMEALRTSMPLRRTVLDYSRVLPRVIEPTDSLLLRAPREHLHFRARRLLALIAHREGTDLYRLDRVLVAEAAQKVGVSELRKQIDHGLTQALGARLAIALRSWGGEFPAPYVGNVQVLLCESLEQAELLQELPEFTAEVDRRLAPQAFLLRRGGLARVRELLESIGVEMQGDESE